MSNIYSGAKSVLVAAKAGTQYAAQILPLFDLVGPPYKKQPLLDKLKQTATRSALRSFCSDDYWHRIWIIQEVAIGNHIDILLDNKIVSIDKLVQLLKLLKQRDVWTPAHWVLNIRRSWQDDKPLKFLEILAETSGSKCGQRHDRIFGVIGLVPNAVKYMADKPSYETSLNNISVAVTQSFIRKLALDIILLASHRAPMQDLPSWCPDFFRFDQYHPESRLVKHIQSQQIKHIQSRQDRTLRRYGVGWKATASSDACSFRGLVLCSPAYRIGTIRSLGQALSDPLPSDFPMHDDTWTRPVDDAQLCGELAAAMLRYENRYNFSPAWYQRLSRFDYYKARGYSYVHAFAASHDTASGSHDDPSDDLLNWIRANRRFFTGSAPLQDHAARLRTPLYLRNPIGALPYLKPYQAFSLFDEYPWYAFERMIQCDMRLMGLESHAGSKVGAIGWAARGARLTDEVFLLQGCGMPVVLREVAGGKYECVGDAIVMGVMQGEISKTLKERHWREVEIV